MNSEKLGPDQLTASKAVGAVWWYFLIRGLLILAAAGYVLVNPGQSAVFFAQLVGALVLIDGVLAVVAGLMGRAESRLWALARGALMILLGVFFLMKPDLVASLAMKTVFFIIGPIIILSGILETVASVRARKEWGAGVGSIFSGALTIAFGVLLIMAPLFFGVLVIRILAIAAIFFAIGLLFLAMKFRKLSKRLAKAPPTIEV